MGINITITITRNKEKNKLLEQAEWIIREALLDRVKPENDPLGAWSKRAMAFLKVRRGESWV